jgi:hypothetical protein
MPSNQQVSLLLLVCLLCGLPQSVLSLVSLSRTKTTTTHTSPYDSSSRRLQTHLHAAAAADASDPVITLPLLQAQLASIETSNLARKEELQSQIDMAQTSGEFGVRKAQVEFYQAFSSQNLSAMEGLWASDNDAQCIHPGMASLSGRKAILGSWAILFKGSEAFDIVPTDTTMDICGSTAICRCVEHVGKTSLEAINIYKREAGAWKMTLHMASPIALGMPPTM